MANINVLDSSVYNLISAGEVIERPASVVKELFENAIDSGADRISVSIKEGGIREIVVTDNGCGMDADNLERRFCLTRHQNSPLRQILTTSRLWGSEAKRSRPSPLCPRRR